MPTSSTNLGYHHIMPSTPVQATLLVIIAGPADVWLLIPPRQVAICSSFLCADSSACGDDCQCAPLLGGSLGVRALRSSPPSVKCADGDV